MNEKASAIKILIKNNLSYITTSHKIVIGGFPHLHNFGDYINMYLAEYLSGKKAVNATYLQFNPKVYFNIGSILQRATPNAHIWGSGFISQNAELKNRNIHIHAVRGKLTYEKLLTYFPGLQEPAYGDPALILPLLYYPKVEKKYDIGIIPHYKDKNALWIQQFKNNKNIKIIDIECGDNWKKLIRETLSCKTIISSSLHGLILADAYHIPNAWIKLSDNIIGGNFKFKDYYTSQNSYDNKPIMIDASTPINETIRHAQFHNHIDLKPLIKACPFILNSKKISLLDKL